ncbi:MAG: hypothetical protein AAF634_08500 [Bacteroidota bacterium]
MKKVLYIFALALFTFGQFSCEAESTASDEELYIDSPDDHEDPEVKRD